MLPPSLARFMGRLAVLIAASAPATSQLITYESLADRRVWSAATPSAWSRLAAPSKYFGRVSENDPTLSVLQLKRNAIVLAAGTYRASAEVRRRTTPGSTIFVVARFGSTELRKGTPITTQNSLRWVELDALEFTLNAPTTVEFEINNVNPNTQMGTVRWHSFVLERTSDLSIAQAGSMDNWTPAVRASAYSKAPAPSTTLGDRLVLDASGVGNLRIRSPQITLAAGSYSWHGYIRKTGDAADGDNLRFSVEGNTTPSETVLPIGAQTIDRWVRTPSVSFDLAAQTKINLLLFKNSPVLKKDYEFGQFFIVRHERPLLYYKFDRNVGRLAVNYGTADVQSTISSTVHPWTSSRFGTALSSNQTGDSTVCDTGWKGGLQGDLTLNLWIKNHGGDPTHPILTGAPGLHLGYSATGGFQIRLGNRRSLLSSPRTSGLLRDARRARGLMLTIRVRGRSLTWFADGVPFASQTLPYNPNISIESTGLMINPATGSPSFDVDELRLFDYAVDPAHFPRWADRPSAAVGSFGDRCGITLRTLGGAPTTGNAGYRHVIEGPPNMRFLFAIGALPQLGFDLGAAFPSLAGCTFYSQFLIQVQGATGASGALTLPTGIPQDSSLAGLGIETQVLGFTGAGLTQGHVSNALSHKIELY